jgi:hypothetical protein
MRVRCKRSSAEPHQAPRRGVPAAPQNVSVVHAAGTAEGCTRVASAVLRDRARQVAFVELFDHETQCGAKTEVSSICVRMRARSLCPARSLASSASDRSRGKVGWRVRGLGDTSRSLTRSPPSKGHAHGRGAQREPVPARAGSRKAADTACDGRHGGGARRPGRWARQPAEADTLTHGAQIFRWSMLPKRVPRTLRSAQVRLRHARRPIAANGDRRVLTGRATGCTR